MTIEPAEEMHDKLCISSALCIIDINANCLYTLYEGLKSSKITIVHDDAL